MAQSNQNNFPPPPNYPRAPLNMQRAQIRSGTPQYAIANANLSNQPHLVMQQQRKQMEQKRRLLQQQQQQHVLIQSNVSTDINVGLQNMDNLLNNAIVPPNVSLQHSSTAPESQLSPNYVQQMNQQNQRLNNQQPPYSPHGQMASPLGQQQSFVQNSGNYQQAGARLSPHPPFNQQLSPRQAYLQSNPQNTNWQQPNRLSLQQQQNPMLNAQLTVHISNYFLYNFIKFVLTNRVTTVVQTVADYLYNGRRCSNSNNSDELEAPVLEAERT